MAPEKIRIVCVSDTHNTASGQGFTLPKGEVLIHAGDLTNQGSLAELQKAVDWIEKADFATKIVIAGNHDLSLDAHYTLKHTTGWTVDSEHVAACRALLNNSSSITYLEHSSTSINFHGSSLKVFGSPYSADRGKQNWAFQYSADEAADIWSAIPADADIVITHTPSSIAVDQSVHWTEGGCSALAQRIALVKPRLHICGHCHEGRGAVVCRWGADLGDSPSLNAWRDPGQGNKKQSLFDLTGTRGGRRLESGAETAILNASIMAKSWGRGGKVFNKPIVVDIELPVDEDK